METYGQEPCMVGRPCKNGPSLRRSASDCGSLLVY